MKKSIVWQLILPIPIGFLAAILGVWTLVPIVIEDTARETAAQEALQTVNLIKTLRTYYTQSVVKKAVASGCLSPTEVHKQQEDGIPLPATLILDLSELLQTQDTRLSIFSPYPFDHRSGRVLDEFQQEAWTRLSEDPTTSFQKQESVNGKESVRVAVADQLVAEACVECHNSHPRSPRTGWALNDVRGIVEVTSGIDEQLARGSELSEKITFLVALGAVLLILGSLYGAWRVTGPLSRLTQTMQALAAGDLTVTVDGIDQKGEIGDMARTLQVFKENAIENQHLEQYLRESQKMEALGTLASGIAHDFGNILASILGAAEAIRDQPDHNAKSNGRYAELILNAGIRGRDLIRQVLQIGRPTAGETALLDLARIAQEVLELTQSAFGKEIIIYAEIESEPALSIGNSGKIHQVLLNLCSNACQAMPNGGRLTLSIHAVSNPEEIVPGLEKRENGGYWRVSVRDTGYGMSPSVLNRIFEPFFSTKEASQGNGLGLAVAHGIIQSHNGAISVDSTPNVGTTFDVYLPKVNVSDHEKPDAPEHDETDNSVEVQHGNGERILIVDDDLAIVHSCEANLSSIGYEIEGFDDPRAALEHITKHPGQFDLVLVDYSMPHMNGLQLKHEIGKILPDTPVLIMSAKAAMVKELAAVINEQQVVLTKPLLLMELASAISTALAQSRD